MLMIEGNSSFMQRLKTLAFRFIVVIILQLMGITISHAFQISFAGFSIGMSKEKVCELLKNNNEYLVKGSISNEMDYVLAPFNDTLRKNNLSINYPRCKQYYLTGKPNEEEVSLQYEMIGISEKKGVNWSFLPYVPYNDLENIQYGNWDLRNPLFNFDELDQLISFSTGCKIEYPEYLKLIQKMNSKYGKYVTTKDKFLYWRYNNTVFSIYDLSPNSKNEKDLHMELFSEHYRIKCKNLKAVYYNDFMSNFVKIQNEAIHLLGFTVGGSKSVFISKLKEKYGSHRVGKREEITSVRDFKGDSDWDESDTNYIYAVIMCPDKLILKLKAEFYEDKVLSICIGDRLTNDYYSENNEDFMPYIESIMDSTYKRYHKYGIKRDITQGTSMASTSYRTNVYKYGIFDDNMELKYRNHTLNLKIVTIGSHSGASLVDDRLFKLRENDRFKKVKSSVVSVIDSIISQIPNDKILDWKLSKSYDYESEYSESKEDLIDVNLWKNSRVVKREYYESDNLFYYDTIGIRNQELIFVNNKLMSIAFSFYAKMPWSVKINRLNLDLNTMLIVRATELFGNPIKASYKRRESLYWIIGNNIFEVIKKIDNQEQIDPIIIFRKKYKQDKIFGVQKKFELIE
jgi:hypothetical protein